MRYKALAALCLFTASVYATPEAPPKIDWSQTLKQARGQTVYFHAWGSDNNINNYIRWAAYEIRKTYGVTLRHVRISSTGNSVQRIQSEKLAGRHTGGSVDLIWLNGENFALMQKKGLLGPSFANQLPNWRYVDTNLPVDTDFSLNNHYQEAPWGLAQFTYIYDKAQVTNPPKNFDALMRYARSHPQRISYPAPPSFYGTSFLKELLNEKILDKSLLSQPVDVSQFEVQTQALWAYLDALHPYLWHHGKRFVKDASHMSELLASGALDLSMTFNPNDIDALKLRGDLPQTADAYAFDAGALSNIHFLAIPYNANARAGALVVTNFLLSPKAQAHKADLNVWGDPSVLKQSVLMQKTSPRRYKALNEPHPSWTRALEAAWIARYSK